MTEKSEQGQGRTEGIPQRSKSDTTNSNQQSTAPDDPPQDSDATVPPNSHTDDRRRTLANHLQTIGLIAAIVAIPLAYWQGREQSNQGAFEQHQRVRELALQMASFWETQLDPDTRYLAARFGAKLKALQGDEEKRGLVDALVDTSNLRDSETVLKNRYLSDLIQPDLGAPDSNVPAMTPVMAAARYRAAVMRVLNTMEAIAIVKEYSQELPDALKVIDRAYTGAILRQYDKFSLFIERYNEAATIAQDKPGWELLIKMVKEEKEKAERSSPAARR